MCPIHIAPSIRAREDALESAGLIQAINSPAVTTQLNLESSGSVQKVVPNVTYNFNGTSYKAH